MKKASKYDKSEIMKAAHRLYDFAKWVKLSKTFGECLKKAWAEAKERAEKQERIDKVQATLEFKIEQEARDAQLRAEAAKARAEREAELKRLGVDDYIYGLMHEYNRPGVYYGD